MKVMNDGLLDPFTFGSEKACIALADFLNLPENRHYTKKVGMNLSRFSTLAAQVEKSQGISKENKKTLVHLYYEVCKKLFDNYPMPEKVKSYAQNILKTRFKKCMVDLKTQ